MKGKVKGIKQQQKTCKKSSVNVRYRNRRERNVEEK
jgi:hypothetical protein